MSLNGHKLGFGVEEWSTIEKEVRDRFRKLLAIALGLSQRQLEAPLNIEVRARFKPAVVIAYLDRLEASVVASILRRDVAFIPEGRMGRFTMVARPRSDVNEALSLLDRVRRLRRSIPIALKILKEWRVNLGRVEGDVDEAFHLAVKVVEAKDEALFKRCPRCRGAVARVVEKVRGRVFELIVERTCCGYVEHITMGLS